MALVFKSIPYDRVNWQELDSYSDRILFQTRNYLEFIRNTQNATPLVVSIYDGGSSIGYFTGLSFKKLGLNLLGSPFKGWMTSFMGFNLRYDYQRKDVLLEFFNYALRDMGFHYVELADRNIDEQICNDLRLSYDIIRIQEMDLSSSEEEIVRNMDRSVRKNLRHAAKLGLVVEHARPDSFAEEYYDQLIEVFKKQKLKPTYTVDRVRSIIKYLYPTGRMLLLRARDKDGRSIATRISIGHGNTAYDWGSASYHKYLFNRPNESLLWQTIQYWKNKGVTRFCLGGYADHKIKFGPNVVNIPTIMSSRPQGIVKIRKLADLVWPLYRKFVSK